MSTLYSLTDTYRQLLEVAESNDSGAVKDTLDSLSDAIEDKAENTAKVIRDLESQSKTKKDEAQRLRERATSLDNQVKNLQIGKQQADKWYRENEQQIKAAQSIERKKANLPQTD